MWNAKWASAIAAIAAPKMAMEIEVVRRGLAHGGAEDLDDPEHEDDLGHLVEHRATEGGVGCARNGLGGHGARMRRGTLR
jgi:hypothetical protein